MSQIHDVKLSQRGRAGIGFFSQIVRGANDLRAHVNELVNEVIPNPDALPDDLDERNAQMEAALSGSAAFRAQELMGEWHSKEHGLAARAAFEDIQKDVEPILRSLDEGPTTLETDPNLTPPDYWRGVDFHRTAGGWDRHPFQGYIHGEIVHREMVDKLFPGGIFKQRLAVAEMAPRDRYDRILEMGSSTGHFTMALAKTYPDAEIYGVELSLQLLEHTRRVANAENLALKLFQRPAEATGFDDDMFDLVGSYILLHELPADAIRNVFAEAFRVLKPGGDMIMSDVTRYADMDKLSQWRADRGALYGGEPFWRESASLDVGAVAREVGFVDVTAEGKAPNNYPYVVQGRKPE